MLANTCTAVYSQAKLLGESQGLTKESEVYESEVIEQQKPEEFACSSKQTSFMWAHVSHTVHNNKGFSLYTL